MLEKHPSRLLSLKALMPYLIFLAIIANHVVRFIGAASDLDFVLSASGNSRLVGIWNFFASPVGNLVAIIIAAVWLTILLLWPSKKPSIPPAEEDQPQPPVNGAKDGPQLLDETVHDQCQREIRNLQSELGKQLARNQTLGIVVSGRDTQIGQLEAKLKDLEWLTAIAKEQSAAIHRLVSIQDCRITKHELFRHDPYLEFWINVANHSVFDIQLTRLTGVISFHGRELTEGLEWKTPGNRVVTWAKKPSFLFRQRLKPDDVVHILNERTDFRFDGLKISAVGVNQNGPLVQLERIEFDNIALTNDALLQANPKLEIVIKNLTATMLVNRATYGKEPPDGIITMALVLRNRRQSSIVVDSFDLEVSVDGQTSTVSAEPGEIWEKKHIDEAGTLITSGAKLRNLADRTPITIREAEVVGDVQFMAAGIGAKLLNHPVSYKLIVLDTLGEKHPVSGLTGRVG